MITYRLLYQWPCPWCRILDSDTDFESVCLRMRSKKGKIITGLKSIQWKDNAPPALSSNLPLKSMKVSLCLHGTSYRVHMNHIDISVLTVWVKLRAKIISKGARRNYWLWKKQRCKYRYKGRPIPIEAS